MCSQCTLNVLSKCYSCATKVLLMCSQDDPKVLSVYFVFQLGQMPILCLSIYVLEKEILYLDDVVFSVGN